MMDFLSTLDVAVFHVINQSLSTSIGNTLWPLITDYDKILIVRIVLIGVWLSLVVKGGVRGRTAALMVIVILACSDQFSSTLVKSIVHRPRPCHVVNGVPVVADINLLVGCGGGMSFPSSHAVNNFAIATMFAWYYRRWRYWFYAWAAVVALSRVFVGVHYPSDVAGGALIGTGVALAALALWQFVTRRWIPSLVVERAAPVAQ